MDFDLRPLIRWVLDEFEPAMRLAPGHYMRARGEQEHELYGTSDMACVLHTLGALHPSAEERGQWASAWKAFIDADTGYLIERNPTHSKLHNTAFALAAMRLLGLVADHPMPWFQAQRDPAKMMAMLDGLDWRENVYRCSHDGAGLAAIMALVPGLYDREWFTAYFAHLDRLFDPRNGMLGLDKPAGGDSDQIGGTFHYAFMYEFFHRPIPHPTARIDAIIGLQQPDGYWHPFNHYWMTLDAIYMLTRSVRHSGHRREDVARCIRRSLDALYPRVTEPASRDAAFYADVSGTKRRLGVHHLTAVLSLFAESQAFLGSDVVVSDYPLRLVLDARPFI